MATKLTSTVLQNAADDEPIFVLRGTDPTAPTIVRQWIGRNMHCINPEKLKEAEQVAIAMELYPVKNSAR